MVNLTIREEISHELNHLPLVLHIRNSESGQHWFRWWLVAYSVPSHLLNKLLSIESLGTNFGEIVIKIQNCSFTKTHPEISSTNGSHLVEWGWLKTNRITLGNTDLQAILQTNDATTDPFDKNFSRLAISVALIGARFHPMKWHITYSILNCMATSGSGNPRNNLNWHFWVWML